MSVCPWRDDFDDVVALHIDPPAFSIGSACRSRNRKFQHDDALENDLAMPAREITSRHGVDRRSLLPRAARRDAVLRNATNQMSFAATTCTNWGEV